MNLFLQFIFFFMNIIFIFPLIQLLPFIKANTYLECRKQFRCGNVILDYPFYDDEHDRPAACGYPGFEVDCSDDNRPEISSISTSTSEKYYIVQMNLTSHITKSQTISVLRENPWESYCPENLSNTTLNFTLFNYAPTVENVTLYYQCPNNNPSIPLQNYFNNYYCSNRQELVYFDSPSLESNPRFYSIPPGLCNSEVVVPVYQSLVESVTDASRLQSAFQNGSFGLEWYADNDSCDDCRNSGGICGFNATRGRFTCYCSDDQLHDYTCSSGKSKTKEVAIGLSVGGVALVTLAAFGFWVVQRRRRTLSQAQPKDIITSYQSNGNGSSNEFRSNQVYTTSPSTNRSQRTPSYPSSKSDFENSASYLGVPLFSYNELEEATENFNESRELGDGGFGTVYYGKLNDGRVVAVKRLYENSCRHMGQFMNEIHILATLRHKNLVTLYGCTSRRSRELLLVYEYISNGTVADHLHGKLAQSQALPWPTRLSIAVETAEALCFLHEKNVIHRDVKTTNILLEKSFQVKVADFGLSRLFPNDVTHVSTAPQGTPGYVDPEYYQCYQLTEKSDVYSFGVVLAELISSKLAVDITRHRHDINLANMAIDRIQKHALSELIDPKLGFEKDFLVQKMVKLVAEVAFQCLQQEKDSRPSMKQVLESLKAIQKEMDNTQKQVVVDIHEIDDDIDVGLLKNAPPPLSPGTEDSFKNSI